MTLRSGLFGALAGQLGHPRGLPGRLVGRMLNRGNRVAIVGAVEAVSPHPGDAVADVGFGGGLGLRLLLDRSAPDGQVHGVELSTTMLDTARRRFRSAVAAGRLHLHEGTLQRLPLPDASLDGVLTVNTIYFVDDLAPALDELARVLKPTGRLALGVTDPDAMRSMPVTAYGFRIRPIEEIVAALETAGLTVTDRRRVRGGFEVHLLTATR